MTGTAPTGPDGEEQETVLLKTLPMVEGSGFTLAQVNWKGMGWRPRVGQKIVGGPTLSTPSHISLLLHNLFNASIPASHIPKDTWHFDPDFPVPEAIQKRQQWAIPTIGSATKAAATEALAEEADAEAAEAAEGAEGPETAEEEDEVIKSLEEEEEEQWREKGWWRHNQTNEPLGGNDGKIEFTIIGSVPPAPSVSLSQHHPLHTDPPLPCYSQLDDRQLDDFAHRLAPGRPFRAPGGLGPRPDGQALAQEALARRLKCLGCVLLLVPLVLARAAPGTAPDRARHPRAGGRVVGRDLGRER